MAFASILLCVSLAQSSSPSPEAPKREEQPRDDRTDAQRKRVELNLLGNTDTEGGESRRNENVPFNLVDNNALKELNLRVGATATIVREFRPERSYYSAEFGNAPSAPLNLTAMKPTSLHGLVRWSHLNSLTSARTFFQVGSVKPARENDYGCNVSSKLWRGATVSLDGGRQAIRGNVNGNVLVPQADERTPLATDPRTRAIVVRFLEAYPKELPNRPDVNVRALNTNAPQLVNNSSATARLDQEVSANDRFYFQYALTVSHVEAFQLVTGQNPNTDIKSHKARIGWTKTWNGRTTLDATAGFDRVRTLIVPPNDHVGPFVLTGGLTGLGPDSVNPIDRALNHWRYGSIIRRVSGRHTFTAGFDVLRRQLNGTETDAHRGFFSFNNDFGRDAITNLRFGTPSQHVLSIGNVTRAFRNWDVSLYAGDLWRPGSGWTIDYGLRWQPVSRPYEVHNRNRIAYDADLNNVAPFLGVARVLPGRWGVARMAGSVQFGEIYPVTFQQVRFSPPGSVKYIITAPYLPDPLGGGTGNALGTLYRLDPELATPYSYQYNASWEPDFSRAFRLQLGYVGSRSHKLLHMWYRNRAVPVPGIPQITATINRRRPVAGLADFRDVLNASRGYYDAARVSLVVPRWHGLTSEVSYWFSKAMDLGSAYSNTAYDSDSRKSRSQSVANIHDDLRARSDFDQPHSFLWRASWQAPGTAGLWRAWTVSAVVLLKHGTPFNVVTGSDGPGFGNVDGNGGDRPNILDPSILGRTIGDPDTSRALLPRSAFSFIQPTEERGNIGRNVFRKGKIANVNASIGRTWALSADMKLTARAESVNFFNTPQFAEPGFEAANQNFGQITNTLNDGRTFRFHLQFGW